MASIRDKYDPQMIATLTKQHRDEHTGDLVDPFEIQGEADIPEPEGKLVRFSDIFWKPKYIPDVLIPKFEREDWHNEAQLQIPDVDECWVWNKRVTELFALAFYCGDTTLLHGLQGTGKTQLAMQFCATLNIPAWRISCNAETREAHFLGSPGLDYDDEGKMHIKQEPTVLTDSLKYGGMFIEDEAFRHNSALVLQALREKNSRTLMLPDAPGRTADERKLVAPDGKWWYVMTDNTCGSGDDTGMFDAQVQDASTLDRIGASIEVDYLSKAAERKILQKHSNLTDDQINGMLDFARLVRKAFEQQAILTTFSVRSLLAWAEKAELTRSLETGLILSWYDKLCADDKATMKDTYHQVFGRELK